MSFKEVPQHHHQFAGTVPVTAACSLREYRHGSCRESPLPARLFQQVSCHCCGGEFGHVLMFSDGHNSCRVNPEGDAILKRDQEVVFLDE